jgi:glycerol 3-phosphatase-2
MALADRYDCLLLDLDGVVYRGDRAIDGAADVLARLRQRGRALAFLTNNSSRTPDQVTDLLAGMGISVEPSEVATSALATADLLAERGGTAFVIGEEGLTRALADAGLQVLDGSTERADWVVVGLDRHADYRKLTRACLLVERGAGLVASNADGSFPMADGLWPGAGALLSVVTQTTGATAEVVGKPNPPLFRTALAWAGGGTPLVVGDRIDTDIAGAAELGWASVLVLTGVSKREDAARSTVRPTYVGKDLSILLEDPEPER